MPQAVYDTDFGKIAVFYNGEAVTAIRFARGAADGGTPSPLSDSAFSQLQEYFAGRRKTFDLPLAPEGTGFQKRVWEALCAIPYGETRAYRDIAQSIGEPRACRAVGMANNKNPVAIVIPCHRVIGADGKLVGYAGGLEIKAALLALERKNSAN